MIKDRSEMSTERIIDLTGPGGNAFALMGQAKTFARQLGLDHKAIIEEMTSGDYDHLVDVFEEHFGDFVTLYR